ncbi:regucalcin-like [Anopheles ziemanni]|uniref:regucalcin-like n=1 Tax=Anopheles coustani TaxID=139045 RepID=UPI00265928E6|nr:regucalcin-like [Anopheles coustani]XP_058177263.1 regucalcin-like [Anopheles ziemanni]
MAESYKVETIPPYTELGEGPHWDIASQSLYYVSLSNGLIYRLDYKENKVYCASIDGTKQASFIIPVKGQRECFVIGDGGRLLMIRWDGLSKKASIVKELANTGPKDTQNRFNDGKADPWGRLYAGTMMHESFGSPFENATGSLYRFCPSSGKLVEQDRNIYISNGLAWNRQTNKFYYVDSGANNIKEYDIDLDGNLVNGTIWYDLKEPQKPGNVPAGFGDGMTIDTEGNLFVAIFNGYKVLKISPQKKVLQEIKIPAQQVTSVAFGGPKLDELFVTTASLTFTTPQKDPAGATFKVTGLGAKGYPMDEIDLSKVKTP